MDLWLLRHGPAGDGATWAGDDRERPLTAKGERKTRRVAQALGAIGLRPDMIVTSPYVRARQTAAIAAAVWGSPHPAVEDPALVPESDPDEVAQACGPLLAAASVAVLVGHEPCLSRLAAWLLAGATPLDLALRKAGVVHLETAAWRPGRARLRRWLDPDDLLTWTDSE